MLHLIKLIVIYDISVVCYSRREKKRVFDFVGFNGEMKGKKALQSHLTLFHFCVDVVVVAVIGSPPNLKEAEKSNMQTVEAFV